jgi:hypothetical protein
MQCPISCAQDIANVLSLPPEKSAASFTQGKLYVLNIKFLFLQDMLLCL